VFPEDGVYGMMFHRRRDLVFPYLEYIPDTNSSWNPCQQPLRFNETEIQRTLSCMARENSMYVVANIGDKQPCKQTTDNICPPDGHYQYNTDVVYDPSGKMVAKYHKYNLFFEDQFDQPPDTEIITFDTPFGRYGVFTCFDLLFEHPPIDLVSKHGIQNIVFPTAWMDASPFFTSIQFHSAFAAGHGTNFLAANIHWPEQRFHGSGIYTPDGAAAYYYNTTIGSTAMLVVKEIPVLRQSQGVNSFHHQPQQSDDTAAPSDVFRAVLFDDTFNLVQLGQPSGIQEVCHNNLCCSVSYQINSTAIGKEFFAVGAFDGLHTHEGSYYLHICTIIRCMKSENTTVCTDRLKETINFDLISFEMHGNFSTPYVYPEMLLVGQEDFTLAPYPRQWTYSGDRLKTTRPFHDPLAVAALFGRWYGRDQETEPSKPQIVG